MLEKKVGVLGGEGVLWIGGRIFDYLYFGGGFSPPRIEPRLRFRGRRGAVGGRHGVQYLLPL